MFPSATRLASDARMQQKTQRKPAADAGAISAAGNKPEQALLRRGDALAPFLARVRTQARVETDVQTELESKPQQRKAEQCSSSRSVDPPAGDAGAGALGGAETGAEVTFSR